jgi:copper chaperone CopZ
MTTAENMTGLGDVVEKTLAVSGMSCANCARHVETALCETPGVVAATVDLVAERVEVRYADGEVTLAELGRAVAGSGYELLIPEEGAPADGAGATGREG